MLSCRESDRKSKSGRKLVENCACKIALITRALTWKEINQMASPLWKHNETYHDKIIHHKTPHTHWFARIQRTHKTSIRLRAPIPEKVIHSGHILINVIERTIYGEFYSYWTIWETSMIIMWTTKVIIINLSSILHAFLASCKFLCN